MTIPRRQAASAARKAQIVRAAISLLAERGYQGATFDAICQVARLSSKRLITYHFSTKEELFAAIAEQVVAEAEAAMRPALDTVSGHRQLLAAAIRASIEFIATHLPQMRALEQIILNGAGAWQPHHLHSINRLTQLLTDGQRGGAFRPFDPLIMARALRAAIDSTHAPLAAGLHPRHCADELVELFDRATRPNRTD